jgi:hypothetical protein
VSSVHGHCQDKAYHNSMSVISMTSKVEECRKIPINHCIFDLASEMKRDQKPAFTIVLSSTC